MARPKKRPEEQTRAPLQPSLRDLELFRDLYVVLSHSQNIKEVEEKMRNLGWRGGATVFYRKLAQLEKMLWPHDQGRKGLVERGPGQRTAILTQDAKRFYADVCRLLELHAKVVAPQQVPGDETAVIRIGATNSVLSSFLPWFFHETQYLDAHPNHGISFIEGEWWEILAGLRKREIDFGLGPQFDPHPEVEQVEVLRTRRVLIYHSSNLVLAKKITSTKMFDFRWLADESVLLIPQGTQPDIQVELEKRLPMPTPGKGRRVILPTLALLQLWVEAGLGVAVTHEHSIFPAANRDTICAVDLSDELGLTPLILYLPRGGRDALRSRAASDLAQLMCSRLVDMPSWLQP